MNFPWLTLLGLLPMLGAAVLMMVRDARSARTLGLVFSLITLAVGVAVAVLVAGGTDVSEKLPWIRAFGAYWSLGPVDGVSLTMVLLTVILTPIVLMASWDTVDSDDRWGSHVYFGLVLALESLSLFVFMATDVLLFYLFFEATLIPMYFLLGGFGGRRRGYAAIKFLLFGLAGGLIMLAAVIGLYAVSARAGAPSYLLADLAKLDIDGSTGRWLFLGFFIAFALKAPMVPFHTWLPDAAEEGTAGSSTLMVGLLDKIGTFGMIRFCLELFPEASRWASPVVIVLALISVVYGALAAIGQKDMMRLIAFTSISHFGFIVMGIFSFTTVSMTGATFYMFNHAFSTAVLFLVAGYLVQRRGSRQISAYGGVQKVAPVMAGLFLFGGLSSAALPGMSSFISEFMVIAGSFARNPVVAGISTIAMVLSAVYCLWMYQRIFTGPVTEQTAKAFGGTADPVDFNGEYAGGGHAAHDDDHGHGATAATATATRTATTSTTPLDLTGREKLAIAPLIALILVFGFFPKPMLDLIEPAVQATMQRVGMTDPQPQLAKGHN
ncbi:NADH-quinone oxidoreductase subunit M [Mariniluteicoccus endophyticus]